MKLFKKSKKLDEMTFQEVEKEYKENRQSIQFLTYLFIPLLAIIGISDIIHRSSNALLFMMPLILCFFAVMLLANYAIIRSEYRIRQLTRRIDP